MRQRRVVVVDEDVNTLNNIKTLVKQMGYYTIGEAGDGVTALKILRTRQPDILITDISVSGMDGLEVAKIAWEDKLCAVVLLSSFIDQGTLENARDVKGAALLQKPVDEFSLLPALEFAYNNYEEICRLEDKVKELQEKLENRKAVEKAKGILMETMGLTEEQAFKRIQKQSMDKRVSMRAVADAIIMTQNLR